MRLLKLLLWQEFNPPFLGYHLSGESGEHWQGSVRPSDIVAVSTASQDRAWSFWTRMAPSSTVVRIPI